MKADASFAATPRVTGYVMAGGGSTRFGADKARAKLGDSTMLERVCALVAATVGRVCVVAPPGRYRDYDVPIAEDRWPGEGPLGGIITALQHSRETQRACRWNLIVSCDMPFLTREWLTYLVERATKSGANVVVPRSERGMEPLCACWRTNGMEMVEKAFEKGARKITGALNGMELEILDEKHWKRFDSAGRLFWNMNTPADYEEARKILEAEQA